MSTIATTTPTPNAATAAAAAAAAASSSSSSSSSTASNAQLSLTPSDFLSMMVTQLQNQDPLNPTSSSDLLAQMSQIGQLQSSDTLQTTLSNFASQTSLSSASSMIGKTVVGTDANSNPQTGVVSSVQIASGNISLELDNGVIMPLANVTSVSPGKTTSSTTGTTTATTSTSTATTPLSN